MTAINAVEQNIPMMAKELCSFILPVCILTLNLLYNKKKRMVWQLWSDGLPRVLGVSTVQMNLPGFPSDRLGGSGARGLPRTARGGSESTPPPRVFPRPDQPPCRGLSAAPDSNRAETEGASNCEAWKM